MLVPTNTLVLVADGRKMLVFRNTGLATDIELSVEYGEEQPNPADRDQKTDLAGRMPQLGTPGQASVGEADYHQQAEDDFAVRMAEWLNERALHNALDPVVIVAAPATLGTMRPRLHRTVKDRVVGEIGKDMTGHTTAGIARMLAEA